MSLLKLFVAVDDFCQAFQREQVRQLSAQAGQRRRHSDLCESEIMTIVIHFHQTSYRTFKAYYTEHVQKHLSRDFPGLVSYSRFVQLMPRVVLLLWGYAVACQGRCTGISFVDSTALRVCDNHRISRNKVFAGLARRGQGSMGWFYGFKLHIVVSDRGDILAFALTPGNIDDRKPVPTLAKRLFGKLFADKGYISQPLCETLFSQGVRLITGLKVKMKNRLLPLQDKLLLRKRYLIETINDQLKNISQIEHSRHRSPVNFVINVLAGLIAYMLQPKKPALRFSSKHAALLPSIA
jgi:hypothetical protein